MQAQYADTFRESVISVLGAPPDPAPLEPEVLDIEAGDGFRREHLKFQVSTGDVSYAYLLIPNDLRSATPTVYVHHRHNNSFKLGKSEVVGLAGDKNYALGLELVKRGYVVFAPDAIGFGERRSPNSDGDSFDLAYSFNQLALRLLRGETLLKKVLWDVSRGIDYLETRTEVDSRFIAFMGVGYGAKMALWSAALEPRIRAAVAHQGVVTLREQLRRGDWFEAEFIVPRLMQVADAHHILSMIAPRAFLLSNTEVDAQKPDAAEIYQKIKPVYDGQGAANRVTFYNYPPNNNFTPEMRVNAYNWLDTWMKPF
ncbi:MAG: dienelactone hydrolase family protein [Chloroflexota bacterium]